MRGSLAIEIQGEELLLHPERAVIWRRRKSVIVADTHFGKSAFFGRHGIAVPAGSDDGDRARLGRLIAESQAERLIVLGDFLHAPLEALSTEALDLEAWTRQLPAVQIVVVAGNHDRGALRPWPSIAWREGEWLEPPFRFVHEAKEPKQDEHFALSGHIHPVIRMRSMRKQRLRVPVFWQRPGGLVLPSFGAFTGGFAVRPEPGERLFAVSPTAVSQIG